MLSSPYEHGELIAPPPSSGSPSECCAWRGSGIKGGLPDEVLARVGLQAVRGSLWGLWLTLAVTESPDRNSFQRPEAGRSPREYRPIRWGDGGRGW